MRLVEKIGNIINRAPIGAVRRTAYNDETNVNLNQAELMEKAQKSADNGIPGKTASALRAARASRREQITFMQTAFNKAIKDGNVSINSLTAEEQASHPLIPDYLNERNRRFTKELRQLERPEPIAKILK